MSPRSTVIFAENLTKSYGKLRAIDDISFSVKPGEVVGFVGPNGAGKSTTIGTLMGFLRPQTGTIRLFGETVHPKNAHKFHQRIGYAAGDMTLIDNLTGQQYLDHMAYLTRVNRAHQHQLIEVFEPVLTKRLKSLSRGNKQKIALIAALQHQPKLLILDEPTTGLDPLMQETLLGILSREAKEGATIFMSSHVLSEVTSICQRVLFMRSGKIILDQSVKAIEQKAGKEVRIRGDKPTLLALMRSRPSGLGKPEPTSDGSVICLYKGSMPRLLKWLTSQKVKDVTIRDRDFDSIFHSMYEQEDTR